MNIIIIAGNLLSYEIVKELSKQKYEINIISIIVLNMKTTPIKVYDKIENDKWNEFDVPIITVNRLNNALNFIKKSNPDMILTIGWREIIPSNILNIPQKGVIGFHPTLLPWGRGSAPLIHSILSSPMKSGLTMFYMDEGMDTGDIIGQETFKITEDDYVVDVYDKIIVAGIELIKKYIPMLIDNIAPRIKQNETKAVTFKKIQAGTQEILTTDDCITTMRKIRAFSIPYNGAYIKIRNSKLIIFKAKMEVSQ